MQGYKQGQQVRDIVITDDAKSPEVKCCVIKEYRCPVLGKIILKMI